MCYVNDDVKRTGKSLGVIMADKLWLDIDGAYAIAQAARCWLLTADNLGSILMT
jgi:hypothetical protein